MNAPVPLTKATKELTLQLVWQAGQYGINWGGRWWPTEYTAPDLAKKDLEGLFLGVKVTWTP